MGGGGGWERVLLGKGSHKKVTGVDVGNFEMNP